MLFIEHSKYYINKAHEFYGMNNEFQNIPVKSIQFETYFCVFIINKILTCKK